MALHKRTFDDLFEITEAEASTYTMEEMRSAIALALAVKGEDYSVWRVIANLRGVRMGYMVVDEKEENDGND